MLDLKQLHYAITLAKHRNYARAAEALDMSQPALSRSISGFEDTLGVQLFNRTHKGVEPTAFGERLLSRGAALLTDAVELERELKLMQGLDVGVLRVGAGPYPADMCVGPSIGRLAARHPRLRIELTTGDWRMIVQEILESRIDLGVMELSVVEKNPLLSTEALPRHAGVLFCRAGHPLVDEGAVAIESVFSYPFVASKLPARAAQRFYRLAKAGAIDADTGDYLPPIKVDTVALAKAIVLSSDAIALAPMALIADEVGKGQLATLRFAEPWLQTQYGFVYLKGRALSPAANAFIAEAIAIEAELVIAENQTAAMVA